MPKFKSFARAIAISTGVACLAPMAQAASAASLVPITVRVCMPKIMYWPAGAYAPSGALSEIAVSIGGPNYSVRAVFQDWASHSNKAELRGADGCWAKQYNVPEGDNYFSMSFTGARYRAETCGWSAVNSYNSTPVHAQKGTQVTFRMADPALIPIEVRSPEGNPVIGASLQMGYGMEMFSEGVPSTTVAFSANDVSSDLEARGGYWTSPDFSGCTSGSNLALFPNTGAPGTEAFGWVSYSMPDGGQQRMQYKDSLEDGVVNAALPYSVPETSLVVPGTPAVASASAAVSPVKRMTVTGGGPAVLTAVLKDEASNAPVANVPVVAEVYDRSKFVWTAVAQGRTGGTGVASIRINNPKSTTYRIRPTSVGTPAQLIVTVKPTVPGKVQKLKGKAGSRLATVQWKQPLDLGGTPITGYEVQWRRAGVKKWASKSLAADKRALTKRKLTADTEYEFRVRAINKVGKSAWAKGTVTPKP